MIMPITDNISAINPMIEENRVNIQMIHNRSVRKASELNSIEYIPTSHEWLFRFKLMKVK